MATSLWDVNLVTVPGTKIFLVQEFDFRNSYFSELGYHDEFGKILWEISKPKFFVKIIAVDFDQAAVLWQSGRDQNVTRVDQVQLFSEKLLVASLLTSKVVLMIALLSQSVKVSRRVLLQIDAHVSFY